MNKHKRIPTTARETSFHTRVWKLFSLDDAQSDPWFKSFAKFSEQQNIPTYKQYHTVQCLDHTAYSVYSINSGVLLLLPVYTTTLVNGVLNC